MPDYGNIFSQHEAQYKASVMYDTWGHLDAKPNIVYPCKILVASDGRECLVIEDDCELGGPAYYYDSNEYFFNNIVCKNKVGVFLFEGTYQMYKNRRPKDADTICYFKGRITKVNTKRKYK